MAVTRVHEAFVGLLSASATLLKLSGKPAQNDRAPRSNGAVYTLDASIDSELYAFLTCDTFKTFLALPLELPRYKELFESLFLRRLPVSAFDAFRLVRTSIAFIASINCYLTNVSCYAFLMIYVTGV